LVSDGKAPDFGNLAGQLGELVGRTMKSARRGVPPDDATPEEIVAAEAEAKADKQAKEAEAKRRQQREADQAAWRTAGGARVLLRTIEAETAAAGVSANDLTVGGPRSDPFRMDTPANHRISKWLVDRVPAGRKIHLRGLHYLLVSTPGLVRPDGKPYRNNLSGWKWLQDALNAARWLGYVPFDQIEDERNAEPVWITAPDPATAPRIAIDDPALPDLLEFDDLLPGMDLEWGGAADQQRYHICLLGEKTGLRTILAPLAEEFRADLLLPSGEPSITMLDRLVKRAIADSRPLVILCFTDCDPTGQGIPATVARKVQAMLALAGSGLAVRVIAAGLTVEQADELNLPDTPLKASERRAARWKERTGREQTEIDALLALQPEVLERMARDAIKPFYDPDLAKRAREARDAWEAEARRIVDEALNGMPAHQEALQRLQEQYDTYAEAHAAIGMVISDLRAAMEQAREVAALPDLPELPEWQVPDVPMPAALFNSADSFVANTRRMQKAKLRDVDEEPDEDQEEDEDEE
jgi:hypothetical protein